MSNARLLFLLTLALAMFVGIAVRDFRLHGSYGGFGAVFWFLPIVFILSLMFAIACGLRNPKNPHAESRETEQRDDQEME